MKLLTSCLILIGLPAFLSLIAYFAAPWLFAHGSSAAFNMGGAFCVLAGASWILSGYLLWSCRK